MIAIPDDLYRACQNVLMAIGYDRQSMIDVAAEELRVALAKHDDLVTPDRPPQSVR